MTPRHPHGLFVDDEIGEFPGTPRLSAVNLKGHARTPRPSIVINFKPFSTGCAQPLMCTVEVPDTGLQQGQGMHGSFSRADMTEAAMARPSTSRPCLSRASTPRRRVFVVMNFMAAISEMICNRSR